MKKSYLFFALLSLSALTTLKAAYYLDVQAMTINGEPTDEQFKLIENHYIATQQFFDAADKITAAVEEFQGEEVSDALLNYFKKTVEKEKKLREKVVKSGITIKDQTNRGIVYTIASPTGYVKTKNRESESTYGFPTL